MAQRFLIAFGAGLCAGVLFVLPAKGMLAGVWLSVLAPMPLMIACMGYGLAAGLGAALFGAFAAALMQPALGVAFLASTAAPALFLGWLAAHAFSEGRLSPGSLLTAVTAVSVVAVWGMVAFFAISYGGLDVAAIELANTVQMVLKNLKGVEDAANVMPVEEFAPLLVSIMPAMMAFWSVLALSLNLWLAARVTMISGQFGETWPDLPTHLVLPRIALAAFAVATIACVPTGVTRVLASSAAVALGVAFALQGMAAVHRLTMDRQARFGILSALYAVNFILFPLPLFVMAGVGVADNVKPLRRPLPKLPNPSNNP